MEYSIEQWVAEAPKDRITFRQAVHIVLQAIASSDYLKPKMIMKGGLLLGIRYQSSRFTEDIDFSTAMKLADIDQEEFLAELNESLLIVSGELPYQVTCAVQAVVIQPKNQYEKATFPSFNLKIGYARNTSRGEMKRLREKQCPNTIKIDYSLNEDSLHVDLIAEKIRSIIQQVPRNRSRRQDIYDLNYLFNNVELDEVEMLSILTSLLHKSVGRLEPGVVNPATLDRADIKQHSEREYQTLTAEIEGMLPDFDTAYERIRLFYRALPWEHTTGWEIC
ncbi:nucleotidyl transferase AbiEii/AbiGii toxin family protein [Photorhabdus aegyptia]|uniref:nucleotidyl transferase AbiEii/AbiGii toxin family protein n=1 Tax=Photorhabdus aegyptia TaxID=2805098 RepID=UPI00226C39C3|nr:nucleotidyl transferase AbiEii/AbiGii toxin family protein [Photorhabdus aegyptia]MCC8458709.1 nucleotidyl transferase AbiEii/AbiGii toxin family protein [Photorhabdus aegyptia]